MAKKSNRPGRRNQPVESVEESAVEMQEVAAPVQTTAADTNTIPYLLYVSSLALVVALALVMFELGKNGAGPFA